MEGGDQVVVPQAPASPSPATAGPSNESSTLPISHSNEDENAAGENSSVAAEATTDTTQLLGCAHYKRKCQLVCPDPKCDKVYTCRICHDEAEISHQLDRHRVKEVVCLSCKERQPVSNCCVNCSTIFGKFFCRICNLFMDVYKDTFHCDGCGLCRVGPRENFFHCDKCAMCMPIAMGEGKHRCIEKSSQRDCPVCLEDIHTSRSSSHVPPCGHLLHQQCFNQLIHKALYTCPICNQSMIDMKIVWKYLDEQLAASPPLPPEFANEVQILCRDCHERSTVMFHFVGLKCGSCGGYNTCIERGAALNPEAFAMQQNEELQVDLAEAIIGNEGAMEESENDDAEEVEIGSVSDGNSEDFQSIEDVEDLIDESELSSDEAAYQNPTNQPTPGGEQGTTPSSSSPLAVSASSNESVSNSGSATLEENVSGPGR